MDLAQETGLLLQLPGPLLAWYDAGARVLPWRSDPQPYHVWLSEVMLQQTRVEAATPYFERFLAELPTIAQLARAPEEQLLKLWEGLGYYNRVRNLQKAARVVMEEYGGQLPADYKALLALPGIGRYSAGAIASIAFGLPVPAVDGNVLRVISRILESPADITKEDTRRAVGKALAAILPAGRPGDFNQALMELGAMVCLPGGAPRCGSCPLAPLCRSCQNGTAGQYPRKPPKKQRQAQQRTVLLLLKKGLVAVRKRPEGGLLGGLWELPNLDGLLQPPELGGALAALGLTATAPPLPLGAARHLFTHIEWQMQGWAVRVAGKGCGGLRFVTPPLLARQYCLPSAFSAYTGQIGSALQQLIYELRDYRPDDLERVAAIWLTANLQAHPLIPEERWLRLYEGFYHDFLPAAQTLVLAVEGQVEGFLSFDAPGQIAAFAVAPNCQSKGVGSALLCAAKQRYDALSAAVCTPNARAVAFLEENGFAPAGQPAGEGAGSGGPPRQPLCWQKAP